MLEHGYQRIFFIVSGGNRVQRQLNHAQKNFFGVMPSRVDFLSDIYGIDKKKCGLLVMGADDDAVAEAKKPEVRAEVRRKHKIAADDFLIVTGGKIDAFRRRHFYLCRQ